MKRNRLYTVDKGLASVIQKQTQPKNVFAFGTPSLARGASWGLNDYNQATDFSGFGSYQPSVNLKDLIGTQKAIDMSNIVTPKQGFSLNNIGSGVLSAVGGAVGNLAYKGISGGLDSGAGKAINTVGNFAGDVLSQIPGVGMFAGPAAKVIGGVVGGGVNALVGTAVNQEALSAANAGTSAYNGFVSNASTLSNIQGPEAQANVEDVYRGGLLKKGWASDKNENLRIARADAKNFAFNSVRNNINNILSDQLSNDLGNYVAYGGGLGRHKGTLYADGGLKMSFMDEFGTDPIGAAIRYTQGLERMREAREAEQAAAAREAEYNQMQQRLSNLETQNQGLQSLLDSQALDINTLRSSQSSAEDDGWRDRMSAEAGAIADTAEQYIDTTADKNNAWKYIKQKLKESGKFNDIQIEGIKYNLQRESSINPDAVGDGGAAFGLAQWHGSRQPKDRSLEGQTKHLIETLSNFDGKVHWIGRDNYNGFMNARTPEEAHYYIAKGWERPANRILEKVKNVSDMSLKKLKAFGGELGTNGTDFTNGLLQVNAGDSHQRNPLGGVPMGVDEEGVPNFVEEGETVYNDYVFSNRLKVPKFMFRELGLGGTLKKGKGMTFADASKKLAKESETRPNDPISLDGLEASLAKLAEVQEAERMKKQMRNAGGNEFALGGKKGKKFASLGSIPNRLSSIDVGSYGLNLNDPYTQYVISNLSNATTTTTTGNNKTQKKFRSSNNAFGDEEEVTLSNSNGTTPTTTEPKKATLAGILDNYATLPFLRTSDPTKVSKEEIATVLPKTTKTTEDYNPYPTWMRYAPVVGAGFMTLSDALGLTNRPDYTYANRLEAAANAAGYAPSVRFNPIGDYMRNQHFDRMFYANQMQANSNAVNRILRNYSSPSKAANIILNGYNTLNALGNLNRQAEEYDRAVYERTKDFNRRTNMFNSQGDLEAQMANARYQQGARQLTLSGLGQAAALRDSIDQRVGAARAANLTNFLTSLGNIGRENFALNQINSDRSRQYGVYNNGVSEHKRSSRGKKGSRWT